MQHSLADSGLSCPQTTQLVHEIWNQGNSPILTYTGLTERQVPGVGLLLRVIKNHSTAKSLLRKMERLRESRQPASGLPSVARCRINNEFKRLSLHLRILQTKTAAHFTDPLNRQSCLVKCETETFVQDRDLFLDWCKSLAEEIDDSREHIGLMQRQLLNPLFYQNCNELAGGVEFDWKNTFMPLNDAMILLHLNPSNP